MPNTSTIKEVLNVREWSGDKGTFYYFQLEMDNGDLGTIGKKSKDALKAGDSLTYEIEVTDKGNKFKPVQTNGFNGGGFKGQPQSKDASFALSYSKDLICEMIRAEALQFTDNEKSLETIKKATLYLANEFNSWLKDK